MPELLEKLKRRIGPMLAVEEETLQDLLDDAESYMKAYTGRAVLPVPLASVIVEIAAGAYNRLGLEGQTSHSEGAVSGTYEGMPIHLRQLMDMYRVGKVGGA